MVLNGLQNQSQRVPRVFKKGTIIRIQVRNVNIVQIGHDATEALNANDGIQLTQANTSTNYPGVKLQWEGELWYSASVDNTKFSLVVENETKEAV